jgi:hypothetical protein
LTRIEPANWALVALITVFTAAKLPKFIVPKLVLPDVVVPASQAGSNVAAMPIVAAWPKEMLSSKDCDKIAGNSSNTLIPMLIPSRIENQPGADSPPTE